jgi:hypothetical protein
MSPIQPTGLVVATMRTPPPVFPDDGLKKLPAHRFIGKRFPKMVDVHTGNCINLL